jgi:hypothetical protein
MGGKLETHGQISLHYLTETVAETKRIIGDRASTFEGCGEDGEELVCCRRGKVDENAFEEDQRWQRSVEYRCNERSGDRGL